MPRFDVDGLGLHAEVAGDGPPIVLLHGFTGAADTWRGLIPALAADRTVIAPDLVGHGRSDAPADVERYRMARAAADLVALLRLLGHERAAWLGYSLGGRTALHVAARHPDAVTALVLEGASPGIADADERAARVEADEAMADRIERDGVEAFVDAWERVPLFASQLALPEATRAAIRATRTANTPTGLANSLRGMGAGRAGAAARPPRRHRRPDAADRGGTRREVRRDRAGYGAHDAERYDEGDRRGRARRAHRAPRGVRGGAGGVPPPRPARRTRRRGRLTDERPDWG